MENNKATLGGRCNLLLIGLPEKEKSKNKH